MMATAETEKMANMFESHPSLSASLESFEHNERPGAFRYPSHRSGFARSDTSEPSGDSSSDVPWSPSANRIQNSAGSGWYRHQPYLEESPRFRSSTRSKSREGSSASGGKLLDDDPTLPANIPLPKGSLSPEKGMSASPSRFLEPGQERSLELSRTPEKEGEEMDQSPGTPDMPNYIRFSLRADMQHRTEPFETLIMWLKNVKDFCSSRTNAVTSLVILLVSIMSIRLLTRQPFDTPAPDLVKIAGLTRSFEPLIYYSERGVNHVSDLQETGIAVWDLGESVRVANMSGSDTIVTQLDALAESLKSLGTELTRFFATVDGDIDNILLVMDWAKRELSTLTDGSQSSLGFALTNVHALFTRTGLITNPQTGAPNQAGQLLAALLGATQQQRTRATLQRTFIHLLSTLESSISDEITHTTKLFALFEMIDRQFLNLQRTTVRELDTQEQAEGELLSSLWQRVMGGNASRLRKFEKNRKLLQNVRQRTVNNKHQIVEHNRRLEALQQNLDVLRQRLVKPVIHETEGSSASVEEQIRGLEGTYEFLRRTREEQKGRVLERLYGSGAKERPEIAVS